MVGRADRLEHGRPEGEIEPHAAAFAATSPASPQERKPWTARKWPPKAAEPICATGRSPEAARALACIMHALVRFSHIAAANSFTTNRALPSGSRTLGAAANRYTLASLRYDLSTLRAKGLVEKLSLSRRYHRLLPEDYSICLWSS